MFKRKLANFFLSDRGGEAFPIVNKIARDIKSAQEAGKLLGYKDLAQNQLFLVPQPAADLTKEEKRDRFGFLKKAQQFAKEKIGDVKGRFFDEPEIVIGDPEDVEVISIRDDPKEIGKRLGTIKEAQKLAREERENRERQKRMTKARRQFTIGQEPLVQQLVREEFGRNLRKSTGGGKRRRYRICSQCGGYISIKKRKNRKRRKTRRTRSRKRHRTRSRRRARRNRCV